MKHSFEFCTNPDTPDYWGRDLNIPPFGESVWGTDTTTAYHGEKSLRIGVKDKFARCRILAAVDRTIILSLLLKSDRDKTGVSLAYSGFERRKRKKTVEVGTDWQRVWITELPLFLAPC